MFNLNKSKKNTEIADNNDFFDKAAAQTDEKWINEEDYEGQLSVDVYEDGDDIVIKSTIAGIKSEDIDISINNEMITIKGRRQQSDSVTEDNYYYQECYWGGFSRSIILPVEIQADKVDASLKNGVLKIILPKAKKSKSVSVKVNTREL
ncbi:Hsp20/alpha crystallin family protein [Patescibacteria group bacterium]|nr:Hsp20/alpha crystallin family protein [Patescibacteria group bacterium]